MTLLVYLGQTGLGVGGAGTEEGDNPHPHDGPGSAEAYGHGYTHDIARAHTSRQRQREGLEGANALFLGFVVLEKKAYHFAEMAYLHKAGAE